MLEIKNLRAGYGSLEVVRSISLFIPKGTCVCLIGSNGAGKTTTLSAICGLLRPSGGQVLLDGVDIARAPADQIVRAGLSLVPEGRRVVANMSVEDNLRIGAYTRRDNEVVSDLKKIYERFPRLGERHQQFAGLLSGGEQQMLAIGRALMARPKVLLLDEPSMGLAPHVVNMIFTTIRDIKEAGTTVLLVEQNARKALSVSSYGYVLDAGKIDLEGNADQLAQSPKVIEAYLGRTEVVLQS